jgi:hypothetical protein
LGRRFIDSLILGFFQANFELLKTFGGIVVPHNGNWREIDTIMRRIQKEQGAAIYRKHLKPAQEKETLRALLSPMFERAAHTPEQEADRKIVSEILRGFKPEYFSFKDTKKNLRQHTYDLIKIIEKKGTAYISVDFERFYRVVDEGKQLTWRLEQAASSDHAVALVGYSVGKNRFYIKDSNTPRLIEMSPKDLFLSMEDGVVLVPKHANAKL